MTEVETISHPDKSKKGTKRKNDAEKVGNPFLLEESTESSLAKKLFGVAAESESESDGDQDEEEAVVAVQTSSKTVWHDDDDDLEEQIELPKKKSAVLLKKSTDEGGNIEKKQYQERLRAAFQRTQNAGKVPTWASLKTVEKARERERDSDDEVEAVLDEMTKTTGKYVERDELLPKGVIDTQLLQDITVGHGDSKPLKVLRFHKTRPVLLTAGESGTIQLYQVDSEVKKEHFLQNVRIPKFPIQSMDFLPGGNAVLCGSTRQEYFMKYDLNKGTVSQFKTPKSIAAQNVGNFAMSSDGSLVAMAGHSCQVHVISAASMEHVRTLSVSSEVVSLSFMPGSNDEIWIMTERGQIFVSELRSCSLHSFVDEGAVRGTKITISKDGSYLACGSNTGIVNLYDTAEARMKPEPQPQATATALLTACDSIAFSHDCQLMTMASSVKRNQVKMMHMRSKTMFANFPQRHEKVPLAECVEFSPHSGYMAVGCQTGHLRLYRIGHYEGY